MYALVEWVLEGMFSIISLSAIVSPRKEYELYSCGEDVTAKFQGKTYPARINKISGNKKELEEEMLKPLPKSQTSSPELQKGQPSVKPAERGDQKQKKSGLKRKSDAKEASAKKQPTKTVNITDINEEEVEDRISAFFNLNKEAQRMTPIKETQESLESQKPDLEQTNKVPVASTSNRKIFKSPKYVEESSHSDSESETEDMLTELAPVPLAAKCPRQILKPMVCNQEACKNLREENRLLKERLGSADAECRRLKRMCQELQENKLNQPVTEINQHNKMRPGVISDRNLAREHKMVELVRGTFVFLYEDQLKLATESAKTMTGLARLLTDVFFSTDVQKKSNLSGENGLQKLDPVIVNAIITYCIACDHFKRQSPADIKQALRNKLGCLRAPSRQKKM